MTKPPPPRLRSLALASALSTLVAMPAFAQDPPPQPAPQPDPVQPDPIQLEQDALEPVGTDPAAAPPQTAKGKSKEGDKDEPKRDVSAAHGPTKVVRFDTDEGTWMDVDISPEGAELLLAAAPRRADVRAGVRADRGLPLPEGRARRPRPARRSGLS